MGLEGGPLVGDQGVLEVRRHQLDEVPTGHLAAHAEPSVRYCSIARRTFERARCRSARWLPSVMARMAQTSGPVSPSTSRRVTTSRWLGGSAAIASSMRPRVSVERSRASGAPSQLIGNETRPPGYWECPASKKRSGSTAGSTGAEPASHTDENGMLRPSRAPRFLAMLV